MAKVNKERHKEIAKAWLGNSLKSEVRIWLHSGCQRLHMDSAQCWVETEADTPFIQVLPAGNILFGSSSKHMC